MSLQPIETTKAIRTQYLAYLKSKFVSNDGAIGDQAALLLEEDGRFVKGPYVEVTPPFLSGKSIDTLISEGVLSSDMALLNQNDLPSDRFLYAHQEEAIRNLVSKNRNAVVATGTGSGKTECFLIPILNWLMREKEEEGVITPGVRALLLYPMNALANDQVDRLRSLLKDYPDITFGRYTGETLHDDIKAIEAYRNNHPDRPILKNELLSRERMQATPPHILLTNYAMLEYLLLRPADNVFFDGAFADHWRFIVLDEAHTYNGAKGTEIAMLLSRLKERVIKSPAQKMQYIATSATLGSGDKRFDEIAKFMNDVFNEQGKTGIPFGKEDLVEAKRMPFEQRQNLTPLKLDDYKRLDSLFQSGEKEEVFYALQKDANLYKLRSFLSRKAELLSDAAEHIFSDTPYKQSEKLEALVTLIKLSSGVRERENDLPLLPARYHVFARALEGAFISYFPDTKVYLDRHKTHTALGYKRIPVFELGNCERCGQEYLFGRIHQSENGNRYFVQAESTVDDLGKLSTSYCDYFLVDKTPVEVIADEDMTIIEGIDAKIDQINKTQKYILCTACGVILEDDREGRGQCCDAPDSKLIAIYGRKGTQKASFNNCYNCGAHGSNVVQRFFSSDDVATQVLAETLYTNIPANEIHYQKGDLEDDEQDIFADLLTDKTIESPEVFDNRKRKLLVFSDSRQEAAFFASYMHRKYEQSLWRHAILDVASKEIEKYGPDYSLEDLLGGLCAFGDKHALFEAERSSKEKSTIISLYLMHEFHRHEKRMGLEGLGLIAFDLDRPKNWLNGPYDDKKVEVSFEPDELWTLIKVFFDSLREGQCTSYLDDAPPEHEFFEPRNRPGYFSLSEGSQKKKATLLKFLPAPGYSNRRVDYVQKILERKGLDVSELKEKARNLVNNLLRRSLIRLLVEQNYLASISTEHGDIVYRLNHEKYRVISHPDNLYRCDRCGSYTLYNLFDVCPQYRCKGTLQPFDGISQERLRFFMDLYENKRPIPLVAKEHTAQLTSIHATRLQNDFDAGKVNLLSCSTTFEMGVDVGQLEAVFLRNVPPETSNYIQRAGRAGRRTESTAFALTYAKKRSHDLTYYQDPNRIISGQIKTPYIVKDNEKIVLRHIYATALAWFFRKYPESIETVSTFFDLEQDSNDANDLTETLRVHLEAKPDDLLQSLKAIVPDEGHEFPFFNHHNYWGWVDLLLDKSDGTLVLAGDDLRTIIAELTELRAREYEKKAGKVDQLNKNISTYKRRNLISFLASKNVLPKYGFPVDVVPLRLLHNSDDAQNVELDRDLRIAISEYAPGGDVVANGRVWKPYALAKLPQKDWPTFYYAICEKCKRVHKYPTALGTKPDDYQLYCDCGGDLEYAYYLEPIFGFTTDVSSPSRPGEKRSPRTYTTRVLFDRYKESSEERNEEPPLRTKLVKGNRIDYRYSSRGQLLLFNQGRNKRGFLVCNSCGYMRSGADGFVGKHKNSWGRDCNGKLTSVHFGHEFMTDVLEIRLPKLSNQFVAHFSWQSLLYAILEGAALGIGINRGEIDGTLFYNNTEDSDMIPSLMLFDDIPGGAGHVKRIAENIEEVLFHAKMKVSGVCGCGEETSCYGCLRNYSNQYMHDLLVRGDAFRYLDQLLGAEIQSIAEDNVMQKGLPFSRSDPYMNESDWSESVSFASSDEAKQFAIDAAQAGCKAPDINGLEIQHVTGEVIGEAEYIWEDRKLALLTNNQRDISAELEKRGYRVILIEEADETVWLLLR